jgi:putative transposase
MMKELRLEYPLDVMSDLFDISRSGYYRWLKQKPSKRAQEEPRLVAEIKAAHTRNRESYGPERLQEDLADHGVSVGVHRIKRIRKEHGIRCKQKRKYKATTNSKHNLPVAANLLEQKFTATAPNKIWVTDITYIPTGEGWLYLAGHKDIFTGEIVGYAMGERMTKNLVSQSLFRAVAAKRPDPGLIHHSDRGSQYCSGKYRKLLDQFKMTASMSRKGNCYDNAPMESFWGTLKNELIYRNRYATRREAMQEIKEYIEIFYNRQRKQARLTYLSPAVFERKFYENLKAA